LLVKPMFTSMGWKPSFFARPESEANGTCHLCRNIACALL
jgi:hypothetical protein